MYDLSIIIVHHRTPEMLRLCLRSLKNAVLDLRYELIVVDSMSTRESRDAAKDGFPDSKILAFDYNLGFSRGVNAGLKNASGDFILILNPDIVLLPDSINKMVNYIKDRPDIGLLGPKVLNFNGTHQKTFFSFYKPATILARRTPLGKLGPLKRGLEYFLMSGADPEKVQTPDWLMGSVLMTSRKAIEKVGLMDEKFFMYFEDVDWARRFWHNDFKVVYFPGATVFHYHQRESKSKLGLLDAIFNRKTHWHIKSAIKFFWKYRTLAIKNEG